MKKEMIKTQKGITLIALVITIIILIILAGVSLNIILGDNGLINKAKEAKEKQEVATILEKLELLKASVQLNKFTLTLDDYLEEIQKQNSVDFPIEIIEEESNTYVKANGKYKFLLNYQANGNIEIIYQEDNGVGTGPNTPVADTINPEQATIEISGQTTVTTLPATLSAKVTHIDNESGVNIEECKYILNTSSGTLGTDASSYEKTFDPDEESITINLSSATDYYLHILTVDNEGNATETIEGPITVGATYHSHTSSCPVTKKYHSHNDGCYRVVYCSGGPENSYVNSNGDVVPQYVGYCSCGNKVVHNWSPGNSYCKNCLICGKNQSTVESTTYNCGKNQSTIEGYTITY